MIERITPKLLGNFGFYYDKEINQFIRDIDDNDGCCMGTICIRRSSDDKGWIMNLEDDTSIGWENIYNQSDLIEKIFEFGIARGKANLRQNLKGLLKIKDAEE